MKKIEETKVQRISENQEGQLLTSYIILISPLLIILPLLSLQKRFFPSSSLHKFSPPLPLDFVPRRYDNFAL